MSTCVWYGRDHMYVLGAHASEQVMHTQGSFKHPPWLLLGITFQFVEPFEPFNSLFRA